MENKKYHIALVDDHEIVLDGISGIIDASEDMAVIAKTTDGNKLLEKFNDLLPDLCIVDLDMPLINGLQLSEKLIQNSNNVKILILTMHKEKSLVKRMQSLGIKGYITKTCDADELIFAIRQILKGKTYFSDDVVQEIISEKEKDISDLAKISLLSKRELEIIKLLCEGNSNKQIAEKLFLSHKTIDNHRTNIMKKLNVHNVVELIRFCIRNEMVEK